MKYPFHTGGLVTKAERAKIFRDHVVPAHQIRTGVLRAILCETTQTEGATHITVRMPNPARYERRAWHECSDTPVPE